jgi:hypothetical protein
VFAALKGPKRLILVPGATHNASLRPEVWQEIERWIDQVSLFSKRPAHPSIPNLRARPEETTTTRRASSSANSTP